MIPYMDAKNDDTHLQLLCGPSDCFGERGGLILGQLDRHVHLGVKLTVGGCTKYTLVLSSKPKSDSQTLGVT